MNTPDSQPAARPAQRMTSAEVAELFQVDPKTVTRWAQQGKIESIVTPGGRRRFDPDYIRSLLNGHKS